MLHAGDLIFAVECKLQEGVVKEPAMTDQTVKVDYGRPGPAI